MASKTSCNNEDNISISEHIGFIGSGNMAQAMISGFISKGIVEPNQVLVSAPSRKNLDKLAPLGIRTTQDNENVIKKCTIVYLAVKPSMFPQVLGSLSIITSAKSPLFVSIAAGLSIKTLEEMLEPLTHQPRVIRVMPNTPCMVLEGCCAYTLGTYSLPNEGILVKKMLSAISICEEVPECQLDAICGVAGSGPAYIYTAIEAIADGGVKMGLPRSIALKFAAQTVRGSAAMVLETGRHPGQLKDEVCSPSGTTIAAIHVLEKNAFRHSLISAVEAAALRSRELSEQ